MFEISGDHIADLNDEDLRSLIGLLCEAEVQQAGGQTSAVTWGGSQTAKDGGLDVRVDTDRPSAGFIPRSASGYQCKASGFPYQKIIDEMRPQGRLRPVIEELARKGGAYLVVSSKGSTSDSALSERRKAMRDALAGFVDADRLHTDFLDRGRIATWVRNHAGLQLWVRARIGRPIQGWQSYGLWDNPSESPNSEYLLDENVRLFDEAHPKNGALSIAAGILRLRNAVQEPKASTRLVGLSGVGKTRLVRALFDQKVGDDALPSSLAVYTDMGHGPAPQPVDLAQQLISSRRRAIVIVDNCPPDLHRRLTDVCKAPDSTISVLTIEYDIRDDQPEGTEVFRLEPSSIPLIEKLIHNRFPYVSQVDASTIANFSGGNARLALSLAGTLEKDESLAGLRDHELFLRLFQQRNYPSDTLLLSAEACSLVYSFNGAIVGENELGAELPQLGRLIGRGPTELYRDVAELRRRELAQVRGDWRAILPHAIANYLAKRALENISSDAINTCIVHGSNRRLWLSLSRRISYLQDSVAARKLVSNWLESDGLLKGIANHDEIQSAVFHNIAPVLPDEVLRAIEQELAAEHDDHLVRTDNRHRSNVIHILRSIAYEPEFFDRSAHCLVRFAEVEPIDYRNDSATDVIKSLFRIYLSGTHASPEQRLALITELLQAPESRTQRLGILALDEMLEAWHFSSHYSFEFGSHSRDHGYDPQDLASIQTWYRASLRVFTKHLQASSLYRVELERLVAHHFRGLWTQAQMYEELQRVAHLIAANGFWPEGWMAVVRTIKMDGDSMDVEVRSVLAALEAHLRPRNIVERAQVVVNCRVAAPVDLAEIEDEDDDDRPSGVYERLSNEAFELGKLLVNNAPALETLLRDAVKGDQGRRYEFGAGLAAGANDLIATWGRIVDQYAQVPDADRVFGVITGFMHEISSRRPEVGAEILEDALTNPELRSIFPALQAAAGVNSRGARRLMTCLELGYARIGTFYSLAAGRAVDPLPCAELRELLTRVAEQPDGFQIAVNILHMRLFSDRSQKRPIDGELVSAGKYLLAMWMPDESSDHLDYEMGEITKDCMVGDGAVALARSICEKLLHKRSAHEHDDLLCAVFRAQPQVALDTCFSDLKKPAPLRELFGIGHYRKNPLNEVPIAEIIHWCDQDSENRYPIMAAVVNPFEQRGENKAMAWSEVSCEVLNRAPKGAAALRALVSQFYPTSWSGSRAVILEQRSELLQELLSHPTPSVAEMATKELSALRTAADKERLWEAKFDARRDERFE